MCDQMAQLALLSTLLCLLCCVRAQPTFLAAGEGTGVGDARALRVTGDPLSAALDTATSLKGTPNGLAFGDSAFIMVGQGLGDPAVSMATSSVRA